MALSELDRRKLICDYCEKNPTKSRSDIYHHFHDMGFKKTFIYNAIKSFENKKSVERKIGSGKKCALQDSKIRAKLKAETVSRNAKSYAVLARKYEVSDKTVKKYLQDMNIKRKKKKSAPLTTDRQENVIKSRLKLLTQSYFSATSIYKCVMDDESYFTIEGNEWQGDSYYECEGHEIPENVKFKTRSKFPKKVLVWLAISESGVSEPVFLQSGLAVNKQIYINKCIPKLEKFIKKFHKHEKVVFWPDLASSHYAKDTLTELSRLGIEYIPKEQNPPNVPQLRPIENFWANLKRKVYANNYRPKNIKTLTAKIKKKLKVMDTAGTQQAMLNVPRKVRKAQRMGVKYFCK